MTPTAQKEQESAERLAKALAFIKEMGEVTAGEISEHLQLQNASGFVSHLFRKGKIKVREIASSDTYANKVKLYSLTTYTGTPREYTRRRAPEFELGKHFKFIPFEKEETCDCCEGTGLCAETGGDESPCQNCNGSGLLHFTEVKE